MADQTPGVFTSFDRNSDVSGTAPNSRCLIWGLVPANAPAPLNTPFLATGLAQVQERSGSNWAQLVRNYQAAKAEPAAVGAEVWCLPVADPAGTSATRLMKFLAQPTYSSGWQVGTASAAAAGTDCTIDIGGQVVTFSISSGDTWATCATKAKAALDTLGSDLVYAPSLNSATVTITDRHASATTDDLPIKVSFSNPSAGVAVSMGTVTVATTATGAGTVSLTDGVLTASYGFANGDLIGAITPAFTAAINAGMGLRAAADAGNAGVITLYYLDDRHARRLTSTITAAVGTTATLAAGTAGSGTPSLTGALAYLASEPTAYRAWALAQTDATALGAVAAHVIAQDASSEKGQVVFSTISTALPGTSLIGATSPALSVTELMVVLHAQAATVPAAQIAARVAVQVAAEGDGDQGRNWSGLLLTSAEAMPLVAAHKSDRSGKDIWNAGISAGYCPVSVDSQGRWYVVLARTTFASAAPQQQRMKKWSGALLPIYFRADLRTTLTSKFFKPGNGKSLKAKGQPMTERALSEKGIRSEVLSLVKKWDQSDYFDGYKDIAPAIMISIVSGRVKVKVPFRSVSDLDRMEISGYPD